MDFANPMKLSKLELLCSVLQLTGPSLQAYFILAADALDKLCLCVPINSSIFSRVLNSLIPFHRMNFRVSFPSEALPFLHTNIAMFNLCMQTFAASI